MIRESEDIATRISTFYRAYEEGFPGRSEGELLFLVNIKTKFRSGIYNDCTDRRQSDLS